MLKRGWYFCNGSCGYVVEFNKSASCRAGHTCHCSGTMHYLEMTADEYEKYKNLIEERGVLGFAKSLPPQRPLRKEIIAKWEKEMGIQ